MRTAPEEVHDRAHGKKGFEKSANEMTSSERKAGRKVYFVDVPFCQRSNRDYHGVCVAFCR
jgi:hypothetical protein